MAIQQRMTPFLWFDGQAEEAANFYCSIFPNSRIKAATRYGAAGPGPKGAVMTIGFEFDGQSFTGLNGGPMFKFTEAISLLVHGETQAEGDHYWEKLTADGGKPNQCAWLKDKFGISWQVVPRRLPELLSAPDTAKARRAMEAMMQMVKIDVAKLEAAAAG